MISASMKISRLSICFLTLLNVATASHEGLAQQKKIYIQVAGSGNQLSYSGSQIRKAATENGFAVTDSAFFTNKTNGGIVIKVFSDSAASLRISTDQNLKMPGDLGWQCYAIRVKNDGLQKIIYILAGDQTGAMYGSLDIAEGIR